MNLLDLSDALIICIFRKLERIEICSLRFVSKDVHRLATKVIDTISWTCYSEESLNFFPLRCVQARDERELKMVLAIKDKRFVQEVQLASDKIDPCLVKRLFEFHNLHIIKCFFSESQAPLFGKEMLRSLANNFTFLNMRVLQTPFTRALIENFKNMPNLEKLVNEDLTGEKISWDQDFLLQSLRENKKLTKLVEYIEGDNLRENTLFSFLFNCSNLESFRIDPIDHPEVLKALSKGYGKNLRSLLPNPGHHWTKQRDLEQLKVLLRLGYKPQRIYINCSALLSLNEKILEDSSHDEVVLFCDTDLFDVESFVRAAKVKSCTTVTFCESNQRFEDNGSLDRRYAELSELPVTKLIFHGLDPTVEFCSSFSNLTSLVLSEMLLEEELLEVSAQDGALLPNLRELQVFYFPLVDKEMDHDVVEVLLTDGQCFPRLRLFKLRILDSDLTVNALPPSLLDRKLKRFKDVLGMDYLAHLHIFTSSLFIEYVAMHIYLSVLKRWRKVAQQNRPTVQIYLENLVGPRSKEYFDLLDQIPKEVIEIVEEY